MARIKVTSTDIHARLARGECANYRSNCCQGRTPCLVIDGESCDYFAQYVKPLLDYPDVSAKYSREAKVTVGLNPKAKVVRKRRTAGEPALALEAAARPAAAKATPARMVAKPVVAPPVQSALPPVAPTPTPAQAKRPVATQPTPQPQLFLELTPDTPTKHARRKR